MVLFSICIHYTLTYMQLCTVGTTAEPLYGGHHWDPAGCPVKRDVPNSEVVVYTDLCGWDGRQGPH